MKINYETLTLTDPCEQSWFARQWGEDFEFDSVTELIGAFKQLEFPPHPSTFICLLPAFPELQTDEMLEYIKSLNPNVKSTGDILISCIKYRTEEMFEYFISLKPTAWSVERVISRCEEYQTKDKFAVVHSLDPSKLREDTISLQCPELLKEQVNENKS